MKKFIFFLFILFISCYFYKNYNYFKFYYIKQEVKDVINEINENKKILENIKNKIQQADDGKKEILEFIDVPKKSNIDDYTVYNDVTSRHKYPFGDSAGRHINVHETAHGIHSDLRNEYQKKLKYKCNTFYCLKGKAVVLREPKITIKDVTKYIPPNLRSYRYQLYFVDQIKNWNDMPTYILDEWTAYILGSMCAVEDYEKGLQKPVSDAVSGCLDFSIYSIAMAMAVKDLEPNYWIENPNLREFIKFNLQRAENTFLLGKDAFRSSKQDKLLNSFLNEKESDNLRNFMRNEFGDYFLKQKCGEAYMEEEFKIDFTFE